MLTEASLVSFILEQVVRQVGFVCFSWPKLCMCEYAVMDMDVQQQYTEHSFSKCPFDNVSSGDVPLFLWFPEWVATL